MKAQEPHVSVAATPDSTVVMFLLLWTQRRAGVGGGPASAQVDELGGPRVPGKGW